ncbi:MULTISPECIES: PPK2 family polyphosphate kinase [Arcicella]|uniref:PPK2 family polyphosphate kinase n=1 Tax=Arcicella aquatica TaxID=217141 RepID=A0ABU5QUW6_9BACT|nr:MULTISPECIES: PPK2 family polyphosphate kinase [Arcicella]MDR6564096.1 PPK2 family polyphosphate:nucleotide phosphotransferase [Arcicella sp. BE51]MDR6813849.1 PPK2 family polyphosphate:nucleotide phosphotransferase [Arcicella sp. BE140]MDR6825161.1 PPK2 family polyphosphate:nucleotide phosphotransferase [Arcicella sp. BE139]MEA5260897.1 PPK2 family polyphosphate kinase [Arcicella aquatica]
MKIDIKEFEYNGEKKFKIKKSATKVKDFYESEQDYELMMAEIKEVIDKRQSLMYADNRYAMLMILQASDAAGKDGTIKAVLSGINPAGITVHSFKRPTQEELDHDFMWRNMMKMPERGKMVFHNRSYYEELLVVKVHPEILLNSQKIPTEFTKDLDKLWESRYEDIRNYEKYLSRNGTVVLKFYLNVSKKVQAERLIERIQDPTKNWKFEEGDVKERDFWNKYQDAYEEMVNQTAAKHAPWYVVPADDKKNMRLIISSIILHHIKVLDMQYPEADEARQATLQQLIKVIEQQNG